MIRGLSVLDEHRVKEKDGQKKEIKDIKDRYGQRDGDQSEPWTEVGIEEIAKPSTDAERNYPMDNRKKHIRNFSVWRASKQLQNIVRNEDFGHIGSPFLVFHDDS